MPLSVKKEVKVKACSIITESNILVSKDLHILFVRSTRVN